MSMTNEEILIHNDNDKCSCIYIWSSLCWRVSNLSRYSNQNWKSWQMTIDVFFCIFVVWWLFRFRCPFVFTSTVDVSSFEWKISWKMTGKIVALAPFSETRWKLSAWIGSTTGTYLFDLSYIVCILFISMNRFLVNPIKLLYYFDYNFIRKTWWNR